MAFATARSLALKGADGHVIDVQVDVSPGLVNTTIVGRVDKTLSEARDRVRMASLAERLRNESDVSVDILPADLTDPVEDDGTEPAEVDSSETMLDPGLYAELRTQLAKAAASERATSVEKRSSALRLAWAPIRRAASRSPRILRIRSATASASPGATR